MSARTSEGRFLWAIGGKVEDAYTVDDTTVYSINEDRWYSSFNGELAPMPHAVHGAGWTLYADKIYCFGGKTEAHTGCSAFVQMYDIDADEWTVLDELPAARSKLGKFYPVYEDRYVFLFGGDDAEGTFHRVNWNWRYDLQTGSWDMDVADAPFSQSFPCPTFYDGWLYYSTGNTQSRGWLNDYPGALNQRYNPHSDEWQVVTPCPHPVTDGAGDIWRNELHFVGGWNTNPAFYNEGSDHYVGPTRKLHAIYDYRGNAWRYGPELPDHWHHGGVRSDGEYFWRYLGTIDEVAGDGVEQHTDRIFRWDGEAWTEMTPAPVKKMNFGTIFSTLGPAG